ncbi:hypothetical protein [Roseovarius sp. MMSF_3305]|uniref:hypothetical protein n=1 Tax=Roseovarius sp. MMSF_3305 TaxID=3046697 RepID=UPI00273F81D0|nr:hypothetical protein [Roseovarius sp. MMSF_3305]
MPVPATVLDGKILEQVGTGKFVKLETTTPFSVGADNFNDDNLYAFDEDQNILVDTPLRVDIGGTNGTIPRGTIIASHYVFFDSWGRNLRPQYGYVDFDAPILGVATTERTMAATDFLANTSVRYISAELRGLEEGDSVKLDRDHPNRLWVRWAASTPGDYIRVFTQMSPSAMQQPNAITGQ